MGSAQSSTAAAGTYGDASRDVLRTAAVAVENDRLPARRDLPVSELQDTRFAQVHLNLSQNLSRVPQQSGLFPMDMPLPPSAFPTGSALQFATIPRQYMTAVAQSSQDAQRAFADVGSYQAFKRKWML